MSKRTTVMSVRGLSREELEADPDFVYVGRSMPRQGWKDRGFGNPFNFKRYPDAADRFARALGAAIRGELSPPVFCEMARRLPELRGKVLGCWCGDWKPGDPEIGCHAVALAKAANASEDVSA